MKRFILSGFFSWFFLLVGQAGGVRADTMDERDIREALHTVAGDDLSAFFGFTPSITISNSPFPNASMRGRSGIVVSKGLLSMCRSPSELSFVLLHEIGHSVLGHSWGPKQRQPKLVGNALEVLLTQEAAADRYALSIMAKAGLDTGAPRSILERIRHEGLSVTPTFDAVYPSISRRALLLPSKKRVI